MSDETPKRGRKASPLTAAIRRHETAQAHLDRLEARLAKYDALVKEHETAEQEAIEAREALERLISL